MERMLELRKRIPSALLIQIAEFMGEGRTSQEQEMLKRAPGRAPRMQDRDCSGWEE